MQGEPGVTHNPCWKAHPERTATTAAFMAHGGTQRLVLPDSGRSADLSLPLYRGTGPFGGRTTRSRKANSCTLSGETTPICKINDTGGQLQPWLQWV